MIGFGFVTIPVSGLTIYTAHVEWVGYNFLSDTNCGDGTGNTCENKLKVKRTTSSSCSSRSWIEGSYEDNDPESYYMSDYYVKTWVKIGSAPCLTFDVKITENSAGDSTSLHTYTISSGGGHTTKNLDLVLGTANGYLRIEYWLSWEDDGVLSPEQ